MVAERKYIDLESHPDLTSVVDLAVASGASFVIRRAGRDVALVQPLEAEDDDRLEAERAARIEEGFRATAGGWEENVDVDRFLEANRESRENSFRDPMPWDI